MSVNKKNLLKTFLDLIQIDSPTGNEEKVSLYIEQRLRQLKVMYKRDNCGNLIAKIPGQGEPLLLSSHMDTVEPCLGIKAKIKGDKITSVGDTILGADDKAGIAEILEAVKILKQSKIKHHPIEIVFTREEEDGLVGSHKLKKKDIQAREGLVLDGGPGTGIITIASPYIYKMDIEIKGKAAHAGAHPEKGISAIKVAAEAISQLKIGRIDKETTNNIGIIQSGTARNGVPELAKIKAEARSHVLEKTEKQIALFKIAFEKVVKKHKAKLKFKSTRSCIGYKYHKNESQIKRITDIHRKLKIKSSFHKTGGGTDVNGFLTRGIRSVAVSYGGSDPHTTKESVRISHMLKVTEFLIEYCRVD